MFGVQAGIQWERIIWRVSTKLANDLVASEVLLFFDGLIGTCVHSSFFFLVVLIWIGVWRPQARIFCDSLEFYVMHAWRAGHRRSLAKGSVREIINVTLWLTNSG